MAFRIRPRGVTLLELLVVLMILSVILTAAVKTWDVTLERGRAETTARKLNQIATVIAGDPDYIVAGRRADFGFVGDIGRLPLNLQELVVSPAISPPESSGWRGPYLRATFNESPDGFRFDGWGDSIVYGPQMSLDSLWVRSLGGRGLADKTRWQTVVLPYTKSDLLLNTIEGDIVDIRGRTPTDTSVIDALTVTLFFPYQGKPKAWQLAGFGGQLQNGHFKFDGFVPQGTHRLHAEYVKYIPLRDTIRTDMDVTVYPRLGARDVRMRLNVDWSTEP